MTPEEYQKLKEAEKDHHRKFRELKKVHGQAIQQSKISKAVTDMATGMTNLYDEHREMLDRLQMDTLKSEARMEVALDSVESLDFLDSESSPTASQDAAALATDEEAVRKARAQALVRQMKMEGGASMEDVSSKPTPSKSSSLGNTLPGRTPITDKPKPTTSSNLPEKTIGRMKP